MPAQFETQRFELVDADKVRIAPYEFGRNKQGELTVWIEDTGKGRRFVSQIAVNGQQCLVRKGVYTGKCCILREKATGRYWFLDMNDCGCWLHDDTFLGAQTFSVKESTKIQEWLADASSSKVATPGQKSC